MTIVRLAGCQPSPLASYLKALGIVRLVAEQRDPSARGRWTAAGFELESALDADGLVEFLVLGYAPTPIVAPWNGASGFFPGDKQDGIAAIEASTDARFAAFRAALAVCRTVVSNAGLDERPDKELKEGFLDGLRACLPDAALAWMDAVIVLTDQGPSFPPLLGTGGNDGHLEFSNNQMQRLVELLLHDAGRARGLATAALFAIPEAGLTRAKIGQFSPGGAGGANAGPGFVRGSLVNPWDYVLLLEGALLFAAAATRREEAAAPGTLSFPFCVRTSAAGYTTSASGDPGASRAEMWLPLWERFATVRELRRLFGEGRAKIGRRSARTGVDFARAVSSLGVDRGLSSFWRVGFLVRNGRSCFAVPLGAWPVTRRRNVDLLDPIDHWLASVRKAADGEHAPASLVRAAVQLDEAVLGLCRTDTATAVADVLIALGEVERVASRSPKAREALRRPIPPLAPDWLGAADDGTSELRLAAALASSGARRHLTAVDPQRPWQWDPDSVEQVWGTRDLVRNLGDVLRRRTQATGRGAIPPRVRVPARLADVAAFIRGDVDDVRLEALLRGVCLLNAAISWPSLTAPRDREEPPAAFAMLRCAHDARSLDSGRALVTPGLVGRALAGDLWGATRIAESRLRGAGVALRCGPQHGPPAYARRVAAALTFPVSAVDQSRVRALISRPLSEETISHVD